MPIRVRFPSYRANREGSDCHDGKVNQSALPFDSPVALELSLFKLLTEVSRRLNDIGLVSVQGEVYRPRDDRGSNTYFTLRDRNAQVSVVVPASRRAFAHCKEGTRVAVTGFLQFRNEQGQLQLRASEVVPVGDGAVATLIAEIRERLRTDGLLDRTPRPLPILPAAIGVVCGKDAAVRRDIESVRAVRFPNYPVVFQETTVSGPGASESIMQAMNELCANSEIHVIVLARGGGDATQLLAFSDETLCRHIAACPVPVVSAIGHEEDRPLSDMVADQRAGTPSIAAALVVPHFGELTARLTGSRDSCTRALDRRMDRCSNAMNSIEWRSAIERRVGRSGAQLAAVDWTHALDRSLSNSSMRVATVSWRDRVPARAAQHAQHLAGLARQVELLAPQRILDRGYAVVRRASREVVRDAGSVALDESLVVTVATGTLQVRVVGREQTPEERPSDGTQHG
jgi:exodeoxyribonuclease VII large subunit